MKKEINPWGLASLAICMGGLVLVSMTTSVWAAIGIFAVLVANNMAHSRHRIEPDEETAQHQAS